MTEAVAVFFGLGYLEAAARSAVADGAIAEKLRGLEGMLERYEASKGVARRSPGAM